MTTKITVEEWRKEVERVMGTSNDDGMTTDELCEAMGMGPAAIRIRLKRLRSAGKLGQGWRDSVSLIGVTRKVPVFWIKRGSK